MKKYFSIVLIFAVFLFSNEAIAQKLTPPQQQQLNNLFKTKKVVYFKFRVNSMQEVSQMAKIISVDKVKGIEVAAHGTKEQFTKFLPFNYKYTVTGGGGTKKKVPVKSTRPTGGKTVPAKKVVKKK